MVYMCCNCLTEFYNSYHYYLQRANFRGLLIAGMDQNSSRSDNGLTNTSNQQQNVHLHMHHVCNCQGNLYPTYYPTVGYRTPVPPMVTYPPHHVPRPYLQHYQYTQYNVGGQYQVPLTHGGSGSVYGSSSPPGGDSLGRLERKGDRSDEAGSVIDGGNDGMNYESGQITPPTSELLLSESNDATNPENFVKFLEKSCVMAEQIAYRNRNRPCFRNIQNLCIRTRSEILKPCTTISNIHSQGIPWATKDFIYAFVRLTNCWHILKGYWDNRDGSSLGKIEKELTPEFRACYVRWEKETMELAAQLTRVFYNLDTNLGSSQTKPTPSDKKLDSASTSTLTNVPAAATNLVNKNVRGIIHLPTNAAPETADQANQTYSGDFCVAVKEEGAYDSEEDRRGSYKQVYMKPGSYNVPKKDGNDGPSVSPRGIEFLETAQNVNKAPPMNDRYWSNIHPKKPNEPPKQEPESDLEINLAPHLNVHEWILNSNFSDYGDPTPVQASQQSQALFVEGLFDALPMDSEAGKNITLLQRGKLSVIGPHKEKEPIAYQELSSMAFGGLTISNQYESSDGGLTEIGVKVLEKLLMDLTKYDVLEGLDPADQRFYTPILDIDTISSRLKNRQYVYVNEIIRDLRYMINYFTRFAENFNNSDHKKKDLVIFITEVFSMKLCEFLAENFREYDFIDVQGDMNQTVGPLKPKQNNFLGEKDRYL